MPTRERVSAFVATVESGEHVEAIERFYTDDASMQENNAPPRVGRDSLIEHERRALARTTDMHTEPAGLVLVDGDAVVIRWVFHMTGPDGKRRRLEELSHQTWRGERIWRERFFYDPAQLA